MGKLLKFAAIFALCFIGFVIVYNAINPMHPDIVEARSSALASARDPSSLQFRNLRRRAGEDGRAVVCGEMNGRNAFGGMTGFQRFVFVAPARLLVTPGSGASQLAGGFEEWWTANCR